VANQRRDFHHQLSHTLVSRYGVIAFEDLHVRGLLTNHRLAKAITDAGWSQFVTFVRYKQRWAGGEVVQADRWFPSSKTCSACGAVHHALSLSERKWMCPTCGARHDRDVNAARNLLNVTTVGATESYACGETSLLLDARPRKPNSFSVG
jgi:putative transposase